MSSLVVTIMYIIECFADRAEDVKPEAMLKADLGLDDLDMVELVMSLEDSLNIELHDELIEEVSTVTDLILEIEKTIKRRLDEDS